MRTAKECNVNEPESMKEKVKHFNPGRFNSNLKASHCNSILIGKEKTETQILINLEDRKYQREIPTV